VYAARQLTWVWGALALAYRSQPPIPCPRRRCLHRLCHAGAAVDEAATKDVPAFEEQATFKESNILLQLEGPEIPTGEPILPPPIDFSRFPIARFLHLDETAGSAPQRPMTEEQEVADAVAKKEVVPLLTGEDSSSAIFAQGLPLTGDKIKLVQQNMAECQKFLSVSIFLVGYLSLRLASQLMCSIAGT